jgi:AcrR family transcriptional regulator
MPNPNASPQPSGLAPGLASGLEDTTIPTYTPKQEAILQGAVRLFLRSGYAGTSMDRVAAEAGVSKQTIYSHFQDKEGLFQALMERMTIRRFQAAFHMATLQGEDPEAIAQIFVGALVSYVIAQEIFYGKETIPLSRDRLIDSLMQVMVGDRKTPL